MPLYFVERFQQDVFGAQVEVVGGFIEQQKIRRMQQHPQQGIAIALAAGEHPDLLEDVVFGEEETSQQAAQFGLRRARRGVAEIVEHARVGIIPCIDPARSNRPHVVAEANSPRVRLVAREQFDQSRLAGAVYADQRDAVAALDEELTLRRLLSAPIALGDTLPSNSATMRPLGFGCGKEK